MNDKIEPNADRSASDDSLIRGGPFYQLQRVTRLIRPGRWDFQRRITFAIAVGWVPLLLITMLFKHDALMSFFSDYRIHSRMLIAIPVLILGQGVVESRFISVVKQIRDAHLLADADLVHEHKLMVELKRLLGLMANGFAPISFAATAVIGATWRHEILHKRAHLIDFKLPAIVLVVIVIALALLPLTFFIPPLTALRRKGILKYSILGQIQASEFDEKWIEHRAGHEPQVLTEMESGNLLNFGQTYDRIKQLIPLPVDRGTLVPRALSIVIPALPTILAEIPIDVAVQDLLRALR